MATQPHPDVEKPEDEPSVGTKKAGYQGATPSDDRVSSSAVFISFRLRCC